MIWIRFVPHSQFNDYVAKGWVPSRGLVGTHHGYHAVLMTFEGKEPPK